MELNQIIEDLRSLQWRKYNKAIYYALDHKIEISDNDLIFAVVAIPENSKLCALVEYTQKAKPISQESVKQIERAIQQENCVESYKEHLYKLLSEVEFFT